MRRKRDPHVSTTMSSFTSCISGSGGCKSPAAKDAGEDDCLAVTGRTWQDNVTGAISAQSHVQLNYKSVISRYRGLTPGALSCMCYHAMIEFVMESSNIASALWHFWMRRSICGTRWGIICPFRRCDVPSPFPRSNFRVGDEKAVSANSSSSPQAGV